MTYPRIHGKCVACGRPAAAGERLCGQCLSSDNPLTGMAVAILVAVLLFLFGMAVFG